MGLSPRQPLPAPPRRVPFTLSLAQVLAGWTQLGCVILLFGSMLVWIITMQSDVTSGVRFRGGAETAQGRVTAVEKTSYSEGGNKKRKGTPIYAVRYRFAAPGGVERDGVSYTVGEKHNPEERVTIEHLAGDPAFSRIRGARRAPYSAAGAVLVVIPVAGVLLALYGIHRGRRAARLLAEGESARARLVSKTATGVQINKKPQYKLVFEFKASDSMTHQHVVKTADPARLEDQPEETVLYDPRSPDRAIAFDALPSPPKIDEGGWFAAPSAAGTLGRLLLPALVVAVNALWAVSLWR
jgi:hypothetical protein